ncbi:uncharacterized protein A4U43_UnF11990 [Asparagus officinalis]|uniref:Uncharacterized protein n=1 Tax=Asparagus officinalis TaxID=4686 RepID=A0A1R3L561_ASPOF|nr:uncharacterized protein A4U43_UnF11990 [Asparagus officinalis]
MKLQYHLGRGHIGTSMKAKLYHLLEQRSSSCRHFVIPLWRGSSYVNIFLQSLSLLPLEVLYEHSGNLWIYDPKLFLFSVAQSKRGICSAHAQVLHGRKDLCIKVNLMNQLSI